MKNISSLKKQLEVQDNSIHGILADDYKTTLTEDGVVLEFHNGDCFRVPCLQLRPYQKEAFVKLFIEDYRRLFLVRPRRAGKEVESWNFLLCAAILRPGMYIMMYPERTRARKILWDGAITLPNNESLPFKEMVPKFLLAKKPIEDEMKLVFKNGSIIIIMGCDDDPDKVRGMNPLGVVFSEYAFSNPKVSNNIMPALRINGGWALYQTTYNGMNHAYRMFQDNKENELWFCRADSVLTCVDEDGNRYVTDEMIDEDRRAGLPEFMIQQEYYSEVSEIQTNFYFSREIKFIDENGKIKPNLVMTGKPVYTFWDLGIGQSDYMAIVFAQFDERNNPVVVNYFEGNSFGFEFYVNEINTFCAKNNVVHKEAYFPHDGKKTSSQTGQTSEGFVRDLGLQVTSVERTKTKGSAINLVRKQLYNTSFDSENTRHLIKCLSEYQKKYNEKNDIYESKPIHNWSSHAVDAFQTMSQAISKDLICNQNYCHEVITMRG